MRLRCGGRSGLDLGVGLDLKMRTVERGNNNNEGSEEASCANDLAARKIGNERTGFEEEGLRTGEGWREKKRRG